MQLTENEFEIQSSLADLAIEQITQINKNKELHLITQHEQCKQIAEVEHRIYMQGTIEDIKKLMDFQKTL